MKAPVQNRGFIMIMSLPTILLVMAMSLLQPAAVTEAAIPPISAAAAAPTDEAGEQKPIVDAVKAAIDRRNYQALNRMENEFRRTRARTSSGIWKLAVFHWRLLTELGPRGDDNCEDRSADFFRGWIAASPAEAAPYVSRAEVLEAYAWCIRGDGYAGSVSQQTHDMFKAKVAEASTVLSTHQATASADPHYYAVAARIHIDQGAGKSEFVRLLDEASSREPDYHHLYFNAYRYFQPQWYGSDAEVDEFARYAAARDKRAEGLGMYARFYWFALDCNCVVEKSIDWPTMKLAMRDVMARYPADWNAANFARIACRMNDPKEAAAWLAHVNGDPGQAWTDKDEMRRCQRMVVAAGARNPANGR